MWPFRRVARLMTLGCQVQPQVPVRLAACGKQSSTKTAYQTKQPSSGMSRWSGQWWKTMSSLSSLMSHLNLHYSHFLCVRMLQKSTIVNPSVFGGAHGIQQFATKRVKEIWLYRSSCTYAFSLPPVCSLVASGAAAAHFSLQEAFRGTMQGPERGRLRADNSAARHRFTWYIDRTTIETRRNKGNL